ncbi:DNA-directed DNA polymerase II small subunit [Candidatus Woesearchaeota archaeon]|jgi:DNA polymerase II small subunit|nr:DNA-directed DNA polymerase II small subunit [Candidatus Woesearchaeota archaeon]MBT5396860.1 DNA-directed DNA polymerase II small subunit [Candidatus Woesearchaeota archaeon]MBT5924259.1 DNA-directed DNA polymerase II small subunit [Candidatus Woesearchaeota archaeon]MBT6367748.1 DNA-directed DNA polymerase II small subunit [Candidatus Woesearchaeota archaeon]MBT7762851.1 DNA-directed DNA polymerase II small subunit [Candidatus Woesearchaeota archaeon]
MEPNDKLIGTLFNKGILVNKDIFTNNVPENILDQIESESDLLVLNSDYVDIVTQPENLVDWYEIDKYRVDSEKDRNDELYQSHLQTFKRTTVTIQNTNNEKTIKQDVTSLETTLDNNSSTFSTESSFEEKPIISSSSVPQINSSVTIVISHKNVPKKYTVSDFAQFFVSRYKFLENILRSRQELQNTLTINRVLGKKERGAVSVIGLVQDINETKNGNLIITLEDVTDRIKIFVGKKDKMLFAQAKDLVFDEVIGVSGTSGEGIIFSDTILWPDVPHNLEMKKSPIEEYAIFLSDIHVGSNVFLPEEFSQFIKWINGSVGNEKQRAIAHKTKYILIAGDLVDGIGIYPSQIDELTITDIREQYEEFVRLISQIPSDKQIIICPGNHDAVHLAEPQSAFNEEFCSALFTLPNITLVTNPGMVTIGKTDTFSGFNVLLYHGYSFDYYVSEVESIRNSGGYHRADLLMKFMLKRRHMAPSFKSTPYYPSHKEDPLLIKVIPDFFITGHIHYSKVANYKGVTMICGSCWQGKTSFQEKLGHEPEPARVPVVNLKTRDVKILKFI